MRKKPIAVRRVALDDSIHENDGSTDDVHPNIFITSTGQLSLMDGTSVVIQPEVAEFNEHNENVSSSSSASLTVRQRSSITNGCIRCTCCMKSLHCNSQSIRLHPILRVIVCTKCYKIYHKQRLNNQQCAWCAGTNQLLHCSNCSHTFCKLCVKRNLGRFVLERIETLSINHMWFCFICDGGHLNALQEEAAHFESHVDDILLKQSKKNLSDKVNHEVNDTLREEVNDQENVVPVNSRRKVSAKKVKWNVKRSNRKTKFVDPLKGMKNEEATVGKTRKRKRSESIVAVDDEVSVWLSPVTRNEESTNSHHNIVKSTSSRRPVVRSMRLRKTRSQGGKLAKKDRSSCYSKQMKCCGVLRTARCHSIHLNIVHPVVHCRVCDAAFHTEHRLMLHVDKCGHYDKSDGGSVTGECCGVTRCRRSHFNHQNTVHPTAFCAVCERGFYDQFRLDCHQLLARH